MGRMILCAGPVAKEPYCFALTGTRVYSLEELGYYLYHNIYTISLEDFDENFFNWVQYELKREDLSKKWKEIRRVSQDIKDIVVSIMCSTDYFTRLEVESLVKTVDQINEMPAIKRRKLEADNYMKYLDYDKALEIYREVLISDDVQEIPAKEFGNMLHNVAVIHVHMRNFESAEREFKHAFSLNEDMDSLHQYLYLLKLQHKESLFMKEVLSYDLDEETVKKIVEQLNQVLEQAEETKEYKQIVELPTLKEQGKVGEYYYKIDTMIFNWKQQYKRGMEKR